MRCEMKKFKIIFFILLSILLSFVVIQYVVNNNIQDYKIQLNVDNPNYDSIFTKEYWTDIIVSKEYDVKYGLSPDLFDTMIYEDGYIVLDGKGITYEDANRFLRALVNNGISSSEDSFTVNYSTIIINRISPIYTVVLLVVEVLILLIIYIISYRKNINLLSIEYWRVSKNEIKEIRKLCLMAIIFSGQVVAGMIPLPSGFGNLGIGISYIFQAVNCLLFGPVNGLMIGCFGDLIGYAISPSPYGFFFPYTINAMLACFTYGICFYKTKVTFVKVLISRMVINLFINVFLGSVWWGIVIGLTYDQSLNYMMFISLPKNLFHLIPQSVLLYVVLKRLIIIFYRRNLVDEYQTNITLI